ncbi:hypothetical protein PINS_up012812 [Pythium insidiosum]|nr:hypothetical protein PINS_up012812 [Pythium insidiosum]
MSNEVEEHQDEEEKETAVVVDQELDATETEGQRHKDEQQAPAEESATSLWDGACAVRDAQGREEHEVASTAAPEMALSPTTVDSVSPTTFQEEELKMLSSPSSVNAEQTETAPRSLCESPVEREISIETAQTVDRLVSFVVHAWGDDVSQSEDEEGEGASTVTQPVAEDKAVTAESEPSESRESSQQEEQDTEDDLDLTVTDTDAEDMIVRLLSDRIALLEAALQRLESTNA